VILSEFVFWISGGITVLLYFGYYSLCRFVDARWGYGVDKKARFRPNVSIVIPTYNEEGSIEGKLKNTVRIKYPNDMIEIIVIDSASIDGTAGVVKRFMKTYRPEGKGDSKKIKITFMEENARRGKALALNSAFAKCRGEIVFITDADCRLEPDVLEKTMPYFADAKIGAITGRESIINPDENSATDTEKQYRKLYYMLRSAESKMDSTYVFDGPLAAYRKKLLTRLSMHVVADDTELALQVRKKGFRILSIPDAKYHEYAPPTLTDRAKQKSRRAEGLNQSLIRNAGTFLFSPRYGLFGMLIYPVALMLHIATPFLLLLGFISYFFIPLQQGAFLFVAFLAALTIPPTRRLIMAFMHSQYANLIGVLRQLMPTSDFRWEKIESTRRYAKDGKLR
jgi:cellulose synthase/poly-beta-1,6-N-acetylglucosamine synthase-like glycosyltransferase